MAVVVVVVAACLMGDQRETEGDSDVGQPPASPVPAAEGRQGPRKIRSKKTSLEEEGFLVLLHGSDPVKIEINRLENEVRGNQFSAPIPLSSFSSDSTLREDLWTGEGNFSKDLRALDREPRPILS